MKKPLHKKLLKFLAYIVLSIVILTSYVFISVYSYRMGMESTVYYFHVICHEEAEVYFVDDEQTYRCSRVWGV